jgi:hypothetical protein
MRDFWLRQCRRGANAGGGHEMQFRFADYMLNTQHRELRCGSELIAL